MMDGFYTEIINQPIIGKRGKKFKEFISSLLKRTSLCQKYIDTLTNSKNLLYYEHVFTNKVIHPIDNYEFFEILGDVTCNKAIVWYLKDKFPFLNNSDGVKVIARLKINLVSKETFSKWARDLDFLEYISFDLETKQKHEKDILEDCFEAFVGLTEYLIDSIYKGGGYFIVYQFMKSILDETPISLDYEKLYDPVTRLKETFDYYTSIHLKNTCPYIWGSLKWDQKKIETGGHFVRLFQKGNGKDVLIDSMEGIYVTDTKHKLCEKHLSFLKEKGFQKPIPTYYADIEKCRQQLLVTKT